MHLRRSRFTSIFVLPHDRVLPHCAQSPVEGNAMQNTNRTAAGVDHQSCAPGPLIVGHHAYGIRLSNRGWRICISRQRNGRSVWNRFRLRLFPLVLAMNAATASLRARKPMDTQKHAGLRDCALRVRENREHCQSRARCVGSAE